MYLQRTIGALLFFLRFFIATAITDQINNDIYHQLGEQWYTAKDNPVALLRAEARTRNPWVIREIERAFLHGPGNILDVGCGAGFLANELARKGFDVTGIDASKQSLDVARQYDHTGQVQYQLGDATRLPFADHSFRIVCAMDFLEHVENPEQVVQEISRVLQPDGLFFYHTLNRNLISWLIGIKGVEWFVSNTPPNLHVYRYLITPDELRGYCERAGMRVQRVLGSVPIITKSAFWKLLLTGQVEDDFEFKLTSFPLIGYLGMAKK